MRVHRTVHGLSRSGVAPAGCADFPSLRFLDSVGVDLCVPDNRGCLPLDYAMHACGAGPAPPAGAAGDAGSDGTGEAADPDAAAFEAWLEAVGDDALRVELRWLHAATATVRVWHDYWAAHEWQWVDDPDGDHEPYLFSIRTGCVSSLLPHHVTMCVCV